jgi:hypothetical protein
VDLRPPVLPKVHLWDLTSSGSGGRVAPTSNDAGDPRPIENPSPLANAEHGAVALVDASAVLRSSLWTTPNLRRALLPSTRHPGLTDVDQSWHATSRFGPNARIGHAHRHC